MTMKIKKFLIPMYKVNVTLVQVENQNDVDEVLKICEENEITDTEAIERGIRNNFKDGGDTWRALDHRKIVGIFYAFSSEKERESVYSHEKRHIEDRILEYYGVNDIEAAGLLAGYLGEMFYEFKQ